MTHLRALTAPAAWSINILTMAQSQVVSMVQIIRARWVQFLPRDALKCIARYCHSNLAFWLTALHCWSIWLSLGEHLQILGERRRSMCKLQNWHLWYKLQNQPATSDISETKQSSVQPKLIAYCRLSIETRSCLHYRSICDLVKVNLWSTFFREQNFSTRDISHTFCRSATKFGGVKRLANQIRLLSKFRELWPGSPVIPCSDMHQSFTEALALVKWFFDNFTCLPCR